jgi:hypothetical protein
LTCDREPQTANADHCKSVSTEGRELWVRALLAQAQVEPELAKALRKNWTLPRRKLVYESLEGAVKEREVRNDIDIEAAIDAFYAPVYHRPQMSMGILSEV